MNTHILLAALATLFTVVVASPNPDLAWFWVDYGGSVPNTAFPGGLKNGINTYIGQRYIHDLGLQLTEDLDGNLDQTQSLEESPRKVLCTLSESRLSWLQTHWDSLENDIAGKTVVPGGVSYYGDLGRVAPVSIGLAVHNSSRSVIGNIFHESPTPYLYYTDDEGNVQTAGTYYILIWT